MILKKLVVVATLAATACAVQAEYSFSYAGKTYRDYEGVIDGVLKVSVVRGADKAFDEREYTVWFENVSDRLSEELKDIVAYEGTLPGARSLVRGILGDHENFYRPYEHDFSKGPLSFENWSGRATHVTFPYFDVVHGESGTRLALGWAGTWRADFTAVGDGVRVKLVSCLGLRGALLPGERIRTGQVVRLDYPGREESVGVNRWRAWFMKNVLPKADASGAPLKPFTTYGFMGDTGLPNSDGSISETYFTFPRTFAKLRHEGLLPDFRWLDAGWYSDPAGKTVASDWWGTVGSWEPDLVKWPKGTLRETTDAGRAVGMKTLCWFEPERVTHVDDLVTNYGYRAEWSVNCNWPKTARTNNLGNPDCLAWTLGRIVKMMEENGIDFYREDNNSNQGQSWQTVDAAEGKKYGVPRGGFCENKFIQGHYALWDGIIDYCRQHGKCTFVDSCASGGGRNDIESMRRGFPLMRSDYDRTTSGMRLSQTWGFCKWIPFHGSATKETKKQLEGTRGKAPDLYVTRASLLPVWNWGARVTHDPACEIEGYRRNIGLWRSVSELLTKDYYTLSQWSSPTNGTGWMAFSYHDPAKDTAIATVFRRESASNDTFVVRLPFVTSGKTYVVTDDDHPDATRLLTGEALCSGIELKLPTPRSSALLRISPRDKTRLIRPLNGLCNSIPLKGDVNEKRLNRLKDLYRALEIPETRFHDVVSENAGIELVDVSRIFPLFHLDENDPRNYNFGPTDLYLARAREFGGRLEFRFGEQIEHQRAQFQVRPPADIEKWARICRNIARHYNSGWANGFRWNIDRFSIWEEPDNDRLLTDASKGNFENCYFKMYASLARLLKAEWPSAQIGGPNTMQANRTFRQFVKYCADEKLPLDFAAYTCYSRDPQFFADHARQARKVLDDEGFRQTELEISEWHVGPVTWDAADPQYRSGLLGPESAAYAGAVLTIMQDVPVDHLFFYAAHVNNWSMFDGIKPRPVYYVFRTFAELRHGERLEVPANPAKGVYALAATAAGGGGLMLVSQLETQGGEIVVDLPEGFKADDVRLILGERDPQPVDGWHNAGRKLMLKTTPGSATFRVRLSSILSAGG